MKEHKSLFRDIEDVAKLAKAQMKYLISLKSTTQESQKRLSADIESAKSALVCTLEAQSEGIWQLVKLLKANSQTAEPEKLPNPNSAKQKLNATSTPHVESVPISPPSSNFKSKLAAFAKPKPEYDPYVVSQYGLFKQRFPDNPATLAKFNECSELRGNGANCSINQFGGIDFEEEGATDDDAA